METIFTLSKKNTFIGYMTLLLCLVIANGASAQVKHTVTVSNYKFAPKEITIAVGDTVEWKNTQGNHNVNGTKTTYPNNPESFGNSVGSAWTYKYVFKTAGKYDYVCDPHAGMGMTGKVEVKDLGSGTNGKYNLTLNFSGMTPHLTQNFKLWVKEKSNGKEIGYKELVVTDAFIVTVSGIELGHTYNIDFYSDHNKNGVYDAPPTDHAWRLELKSAIGDSYFNFAHNTNFTNIFPTTAISDFAEQKFSIYPNPTEGQFYVETKSNNETKISVYDLTGKLKLSRVFSGQNKIPVDIQHLQNGIYLVEVKSENHQSRYKLIKN